MLSNKEAKRPDVDEKKKYVDIDERKYCLGKDCPDKNCRICPAIENSRFILDVTDSYRQSVPGGYYTSTIMRYVDPETGKEKYCYTRPG